MEQQGHRAESNLQSDLTLPMLQNCQILISDNYILLIQGNSKGYEQCKARHIPPSGSSEPFQLTGKYSVQVTYWCWQLVPGLARAHHCHHH